MCDGIVKRFAVIINGDTEERHIHYVEHAEALFEAKGYDVHVASRGGPFGNAAFHPPTKQGIEEITTAIEARIDDDDEIVIFTTGHGGECGGGSLVLEDGCLPMGDEAFRRLNALRYGERTVIMSQCYGGNWARFFAGDPKTLFVSASLQGELAYAEPFNPWLFRPDADVRDANGDGTISWRERYWEMMLAGPQYSATLFLQGQAYEDNGVAGARVEEPRFAAGVQEVSSPAEFEDHIKGLKAGELAVVVFSAPWCGPCHDYRPRFDELAKSSNGRVLFLFVTDSSRPDWDRMGISGYPTVRLYDGQGRFSNVDNRDDPLAEAWRLSGADREDPAYWAWQFLEGRKKLREIPRRMFGEIGFIKAVRESIGLHRGFLLPEKRADRSFVLDRLEFHDEAFLFADPSLKSDQSFVLEAVRRNPRVILNLDLNHRDLRGSIYHIILEAVRGDGRILEDLARIYRRLPSPYTNDGDINYPDLNSYSWGLTDGESDWFLSLAAIESPYPPYHVIPDWLWKNREFVLEAVRRKGQALSYADAPFKNDREIVLEAVKNHGWALEYASERLRNDRQIVLEAVKNRASALGYASERLRGDRKIVLTAVKELVWALQYADADLLKNRKFLLEALARNPGVLDVIDQALFKDRSFALAACRITTHAFAHLPPALQNDPEIRRAAGLERIIGR